MAMDVRHIFFKTSLVAENYDVESITTYNLFREKKDHLVIKSRWGKIRIFIEDISQVLNQDFHLDFLNVGYDENYPQDREDMEKTQLIFSLEQQIKVVNSCQKFFKEIGIQKPKLYGYWELANYLNDTQTFETEDLVDSIDYDNDDPYSNMLTIELIKRFFEESIKEKMLIIKYIF